MHKLIIAICMAIASHFSLAGGHQEKPDGGLISMPSKVPAGAVTTLMVSAKNPQAYKTYLADNPNLFSSLGSSASGVCITQTGHDYPGQMFVWSFYDSVGQALEQFEKYDPLNAPRRLGAMREVKSAAVWKPLKVFEVTPGFERVVRVKVKPGNLAAFVEATVKAESEAAAAGNDVKIGVFAPIGGGLSEMGKLTLRFVQPSANAMGSAIEDFYQTPPTLDSDFVKMISMIKPISDNIEICEQVYTRG